MNVIRSILLWSLTRFRIDFNPKMEKYSKFSKIGEGTYGVVYQGLNRATGERVAMKNIKLESGEGIPSTAIKEISLLKSLEHPNIVRLYDVIHISDKEITLVFEYLDQDLYKYMEEVGVITTDIIKCFLRQLLIGIAYCHERRIYHRDLKPQNLLINKNQNELKLADFGLARSFGIPLRNKSNSVVTLWYRSPEILLGSTKYTSAIDMWSIGCIFAEMAAGRSLFPGHCDEDQLLEIYKVLGSPEAEWPEIKNLPDYQEYLKFVPRDLDVFVPGLCADGIDLLKKMLQYDPSKRISAKKALAHPFLKEIALNV